MRVVEPVTILPENIVESNLFDSPYAPWYSGGTWNTGDYVHISADGGYKFYKSLQNGNTNNPPDTSPTWWVYSSFTYPTYSQGTAYPLGYRARETSTNLIWESLTENNTGILDPVATPPWLNIGTNASILPANFNIATTYAIGELVYTQLVVLGGTFGQPNTVVSQAVYKSLQNGNVGHDPFINASSSWWEFRVDFPVPWLESVNYSVGRVVYTSDGKLWKTPYGIRWVTPASKYTSNWVKIGPSNRTAMFDNQSFTTSVANKEIRVTIPTGIIDTVALINVSADMATVTVRNGLGGSVVYTKTVGLTGGNPTNAWDYYFSDPLLRTNQYIFDNIPPFSNSHVTLELTGGTEVSIGNLIVGKSKDLGLSVYGAQAGILDFSTKTTDFFGSTLFTKRGYKKTLSIQTEVKKEKINQVQRLLYNLRTIPALWISTTDTELSEPLVLFGFYKDFSTTISYPTHALCSLEIEGLV